MQKSFLCVCLLAMSSALNAQQNPQPKVHPDTSALKFETHSFTPDTTLAEQNIAVRFARPLLLTPPKGVKMLPNELQAQGATPGGVVYKSSVDQMPVLKPNAPAKGKNKMPNSVITAP